MVPGRLGSGFSRQPDVAWESFPEVLISPQAGPDNGEGERCLDARLPTAAAGFLL
jgi:hypothetical protein